MKISIGTTSELKVRALEEATNKLAIKAEILPVKTDSGVSKQPFGYDEIIFGAKTRANRALTESNADIGVGVENGLVEINSDYFDVACVYVISKNNTESMAFSPAILMPRWIINEIKEKDTEVGEITKRLSGDSEKDGFKYFTNGVIKRTDALVLAIIFAFAKIFNKEKYENNNLR